MIPLNFFTIMFFSPFSFLFPFILTYDEYPNAPICIGSNIIDLDLDLDYITEDRDLQKCSAARFRV